VLFVCVANENRSQIAEAVFNDLSKNNSAISAGLKPKLVGASLGNERSRFVAVMKEEGYSISNARVKRVNKKLANSAGKIVFVFEAKHLQDAPAYLLNRSGTELWQVESISDEVSIEEYARLERKRIRKIRERVEELVNRLESQ